MPSNWPKKLKTSRISFNLDNVKSMVEGVEGLNKLSLEVGVLRDKKSKELAIYHEYGTFRSTVKGKVAHIPARSFLRASQRSAGYDLIPEMQENLVNAAIGSKHKTFIGAERLKNIGVKLLNKLGKDIQILMKSFILNHISPKLKQATVASKKRAGWPLPETPLIASGKMYQNINYRVRDAGKFVAKT